MILHKCNAMQCFFTLGWIFQWIATNMSNLIENCILFQFDVDFNGTHKQWFMTRFYISQKMKPCKDFRALLRFGNGDCSIGKSILHKPVHRMKLTLSFSFIYEAICLYTFSPARNCIVKARVATEQTILKICYIQHTKKRKHYINANT